MFRFPEVAVVTMTLTGEEHAASLQSSLETLSHAGFRVAVADGGSPDWFVANLRRLPGFDVRSAQQPGLVGQVSTAVALARCWNTPFLFYTEPDKAMFFSAHLVSFLERALSDKKAGVVVAARSPLAFGTFPETQQTTETCLNTLCGSLTGVATDYTYGPFLADAALMGHVERLDASLGWGWRTFLFVLARRMGFRISAVTGDFACPVGDRVETEADRLHRMRQLGQNVNGLVDATGKAL